MLIKVVVRRERLDCCCTDGEFGEARGTNENPGRTTSALLDGMVVAVNEGRYEKGSCQWI